MYFYAKSLTDQHVEVVHEVYREDGHLEHELEVVDVDAPVLPDALVIQVVQVHRVPDDHVQRL